MGWRDGEQAALIINYQLFLTKRRRGYMAKKKSEAEARRAEGLQRSQLGLHDQTAGVADPVVESDGQ